MDFATQYLEDEETLIELKRTADELLDQYNSNQLNQFVHLYNMKTRRCIFELSQIQQREKLEHLQYEEKMDLHVTMLTSVLAVELLPIVEKYVDKQNKWLKRKQQFIQEFDTVTSLLFVLRKSFNIEYANIQLRQELEKKHLSELNELHIENLHKLDQSLLYQDIEKLNKLQNVEISDFLYYQQKNNTVSLQHLKKENELAIMISKIQVKDQLPPFDDNINMLKNGYRSLHCKIPSLPKNNSKTPLENTTICMEEIYFQFYFIQNELIKMYPKMVNVALEMNNFLRCKNMRILYERENFLKETPRCSFDD